MAAARMCRCLVCAHIKVLRTYVAYHHCVVATREAPESDELSQRVPYVIM